MAVIPSLLYLLVHDSHHFAYRYVCIHLGRALLSGESGLRGLLPFERGSIYPPMSLHVRVRDLVDHLPSHSTDRTNPAALEVDLYVGQAYDVVRASGCAPRSTALGSSTSFLQESKAPAILLPMSKTSRQPRQNAWGFWALHSLIEKSGALDAGLPNWEGTAWTCNAVLGEDDRQYWPILTAHGRQPEPCAPIDHSSICPIAESHNAMAQFLSARRFAIQLIGTDLTSYRAILPNIPCIGTALGEQMPRQEGIVSSAAEAMPLLRGTISNNQSVAKEMEAINVGMQIVRMDHFV